jgi:peptidoglycan hydrolase-like protein with peptidoglycan-binding domain
LGEGMRRSCTAVTLARQGGGLPRGQNGHWPMRARVLIALPLLLLGTAAPASATGDPVVAGLQAALAQRGVYDGSVDGVNGPSTTAAVMALQKERGLPADGVVGPRTRAALGALGRHRPGSRLLHRDERGLDVAALQFQLAWHGFPCGVFDGAFGEHTEAALLRFQRWARLFPDGLAGAATFGALARPVPVEPLALRWPVAGIVGSSFGPRGDAFHPGIDIVAMTGAPVLAAAAGKVRFAGWNSGGYGDLVVVKHPGGVASFYAHLSEIDVRPGQVVAAGQQLGLVGETGLATGPHLHFETRLHGAAVDPLPALR